MPWVVLRRTEFCVCGEMCQVHSPQILVASWMSLGKMVTHLAWMAQSWYLRTIPRGMLWQPPGGLAVLKIGIAFAVPLQL